jgi:hypothetical protein
MLDHAYDDCRGSELAKSSIWEKLRNQASLLKNFARKWRAKSGIFGRNFKRDPTRSKPSSRSLSPLQAVWKGSERIMGVEGAHETVLPNQSYFTSYHSSI